MAMQGSYAYIGDEMQGLWIFDIADSTQPLLAGHYRTPGSVQDVVVSGDYAYLADWENFRIINIANPAAPYETGFCATNGGSRGVAISGNYAYIAEGGNGLPHRGHQQSRRAYQCWYL